MEGETTKTSLDFVVIIDVSIKYKPCQNALPPAPQKKDFDKYSKKGLAFRGS